MSMDDEFEALIGQLGEPTVEDSATPEGVGVPQQGEGAYLDELPEPPEGTPVLDALTEWEIRDGVLHITAAHPLVLLVAALATKLAEGHTALNPMSRLDIDQGDLRHDSMSLHTDELLTGAQRALTAFADLLTGELDVAGLFDASRGAQNVRLALSSGDITLGDMENVGAVPSGLPDEIADEIAEQLSMICSGLSGDLITLATS